MLKIMKGKNKYQFTQWKNWISGFSILNLIFLLEILGVMYLYFSGKGKGILTSDMTICMQRLEQCLKEKTLYPQNWYYTNTISLPISTGVLAVFFKMTGDYILSIMCVDAVQLLFAIGCIFYFLNSVIKLDKKLIVVCLILFLLPFSYTYMFEILFDGYSYRVGIWFLMLSFGVLVFSDNELRIRKKYLALYCMVFVLFALGDMRYLATIVLPLIVSFVCCYVLEYYDYKINELKMPFKRMLIYLIAIGGTVIFCKVTELVLKQNLPFISGGYYGLKLQGLSEIFEGFQRIISSYLEAFGFIDGIPLMSFYSVISFCVICYTTYICLINPILMLVNLKKYSLVVRRIIVFRWVGWLVSIYFWLFGGTNIVFRHIITYAILDVFLAVYYMQTMLVNDTIIKVFAWSVLMFYICLNWMYIPKGVSEETVESRLNIISRLEEKGLQYGYSPYWTASVTSAFSQGKLKIYPWDMNGRIKWYSPVELYLPVEMEENTFLLLTEQQYQEYMQNLDFNRRYGNYIETIQDSGYTVLIYNYNIAGEFNEFIFKTEKNLLKYLYVSSSNEESEDLIYSNEVICLKPEGFTYGPYMHVDKGIYSICVIEDGDASLSVYSISGGKTTIFAMQELHEGVNQIPLILGEDVDNLEFNIRAKQNVLKITEVKLIHNADLRSQPKQNRAETLLTAL